MKGDILTLEKLYVSALFSCSSYLRMNVIDFEVRLYYAAWYSSLDGRSGYVAYRLLRSDYIETETLFKRHSEHLNKIKTQMGPDIVAVVP